MKKMLLMLALAACSLNGALAKDLKKVVLTTTPQMSCHNCENKIKNNIRFEKGVKEIETNLDAQTVTVTYDADKTNVESLIAGFKKIGYTATEAKTGGCCKKAEGQGCCKGDGQGCCKKNEQKQDKKKDDCCK